MTEKAVEGGHCCKLVGRRRDIVVVVVGKSNVTIYLTGVHIYSEEAKVAAARHSWEIK